MRIKLNWIWICVFKKLIFPALISSTPRQRSSAALATALYNSGPATGSFNSSGRSSNCDDGDMQSDISLEDDVIDLNNKVGEVVLGQQPQRRRLHPRRFDPTSTLEPSIPVAFPLPFCELRIRHTFFSIDSRMFDGIETMRPLRLSVCTEALSLARTLSRLLKMYRA